MEESVATKSCRRIKKGFSVCGIMNNTSGFSRYKRSTVSHLAVFAIFFCAFSVFAQDVKVRNYRKGTAEIPAAEALRVRNIKPLDPPPYAGESPFAFSVMPIVEYPNRSWDSDLLRFNLFVGAHRNVYWLDVGTIGNISDHEMNGLGIAGIFNDVGTSSGAIHVAGVCNHADWNFSGLQLAAGFCWTEGFISGFQVALVNAAGRLHGLQVGGMNVSEHGAGVQIGILNLSDRFEGLQIGLLNVNRSSAVPVFPLVNFAF